MTEAQPSEEQILDVTGGDVVPLWPAGRWTVTEAVLFWLAIQGVGYYGYLLINRAYYHLAFLGTPGITVLGAATIFVCSTGLLFAWMRVKGYGVTTLGLRTPTSIDLVLGFGAGCLAPLLALALKAISGITRTPPSPWFLLLGVVILDPVIEEIAWRGMFYQALRRRWRPAIAIVVSSLVWSASHLFTYPLAIFPSIFVTGVILAALFEWRRNLWVTIVAHATFNLLATFIFGRFIFSG